MFLYLDALDLLIVDVDDVEIPIPSEIPYPPNCNMIQNTVEYINSVPSPLFNFSVDVFGDVTLTNYDSAVESEYPYSGYK